MRDALDLACLEPDTEFPISSYLRVARRSVLLLMRAQHNAKMAQGMAGAGRLRRIGRALADINASADLDLAAARAKRLCEAAPIAVLR